MPLTALRIGRKTNRKKAPVLFVATFITPGIFSIKRMSENREVLFRMPTKYGEPFFHSINGVMLPSFKFSESGKNTISVEIAGIFFIPIEPVFANFSAMVIPTTEGKLEITLSVMDNKIRL